MVFFYIELWHLGTKNLWFGDGPWKLEMKKKMEQMRAKYHSGTVGPPWLVMATAICSSKHDCSCLSDGDNDSLCLGHGRSWDGQRLWNFETSIEYYKYVLCRYISQELELTIFLYFSKKEAQKREQERRYKDGSFG